MTESVGMTTTFNMPVDEIIEFALEQIGGEHINHKEAKLARTALNLLLIDLQNNGMAPLASLKLIEVDLVSGSGANYELNGGVFNVLDAVVEVSTSANKTDLPLTRLSYQEYLEIPTKENSKARPTQFHVDRQRDNIKINLWPVPDKNNYKFKAWVLEKIKDVTQSYQLVDIPSRYLPAVVNGLTYYLAKLRPGSVPLQEREVLKRDYLEALDNALSEDRERVDFMVYPGNKGLLGK